MQRLGDIVHQKGTLTAHQKLAVARASLSGASYAEIGLMVSKSPAYIQRVLNPETGDRQILNEVERQTAKIIQVMAHSHFEFLDMHAQAMQNVREGLRSDNEQIRSTYTWKVIDRNVPQRSNTQELEHRGEIRHTTDPELTGVLKQIGSAMKAVVEVQSNNVRNFRDTVRDGQSVETAPIPLPDVGTGKPNGNRYPEEPEPPEGSPIDDS